MLDLGTHEGPAMKPCALASLVAICLSVGCWPLAADVPGETAGAELDRKISALIEQLGADEYAVRQRAQEELLEIGYDAFDLLCEAENSDDPEIAVQAGYLVRTIRVQWTSPADPRAIQAILGDYESQADERRLVRIKQLAELPNNQGLEWLCRLVRFEASPELSKHAALAIMAQGQPAEKSVWDERSATIGRHMSRSRRAAAAWLLCYLQAHDDPAGALAAWNALTQGELARLETHPQDTSSRIVMELLLEKVRMLDRLGRPDEVDAVMREIVQCERGDAESLAKLIDWLVERKAWPIVDEVGTRFAATIELDAVLLYTLSEARRAAGNGALAEETADKALKLGGDNPLEHLEVAKRLLERGLTEWSDRELSHVIALGPPASPAAIQARLLQSDSLHDRLRDREAGGRIKELMDLLDGDANVQQQVKLLLQQSDKTIDFLRARMYFYFACAAGAEKKVDEQRDFLDKAIDEEPGDLDVIIALHKLKDDDPNRKQRIANLIKSMVDDCREKMEEFPDDPVYYNELAWLVANTEGDVDEAIRLSHKSVELVRAEAISDEDFKRLGQYLDTLAHCYFAKRDYAAAVKYQTEAAKLDPHTRAIGRQLEVFRAALASAGAPAAAAQQ
jgi:tetratricopeptide (TPR) repeat protein